MELNRPLSRPGLWRPGEVRMSGPVVVGKQRPAESSGRALAGWSASRPGRHEAASPRGTMNSDGASRPTLRAFVFLWLMGLTFIGCGAARCVGASGQIVSVAPSTFLAGEPTLVTVTVKNTGAAGEFLIQYQDTYCDPYNGVPTGWSIRPLKVQDLNVFGDYNPTIPANSTYVATFEVTPPAAGGTGAFLWKFRFDDWFCANPVLAIREQLVTALRAPPTITAVSPNPVTGSCRAQRFVVSGLNFAPGCRVTLRDLTAGEPPFTDRPIVSQTSAELVLEVSFTVEAHDWSVEVINPGPASSGQFAFSVVSPSPPPDSLLSPVAGDFRTTGPDNPDCEGMRDVWTFCQHQTGFHKPGSGIADADDTYAWDMNLWQGTDPNADKDQRVYAVAHGRVVKWAGEFTPGAVSGAVLLEHELDGRTWWTGYLHMTDIQVTEGQAVTTGTFLGKIGNVCADCGGSIPGHLHFAVYSGGNCRAALKSRNASFAKRSAVFCVPMDAIGAVAGSTPPTLSPPPELPPYRPGASQLVLIAHGWTPWWCVAPVDFNSCDDSWVGEMSAAIELGSPGDWQVVGYRWTKESYTLLGPATVVAAAERVGEQVGAQIVERGTGAPKGRWSHVHLIGNSAGAALVERAGQVIKAMTPETTIHTTFLDPFVGFLQMERSAYGASSHWSDSYFASDVVTDGLTEGALDHAHNVDVTALDPKATTTPVYCCSSATTITSLSDICGTRFLSSHDWPRRFYLQTVKTRDWPEARDYGFQLSKEAGGWNDNAGRYSVGNVPVALGQPSASEPISQGLMPYEFEPALDLTLLPWAASDNGVTLLSSRAVAAQATGLGGQRFHSVRGKASVRPTSDPPPMGGTPAWFSIGTVPPDRVNVLRFGIQFISTPGARGLLTIFWNNRVVGLIDEAYARKGIDDCTFRLSPPVPGVASVLGFRLEAHSFAPSVVIITNISLGLVGPSQAVRLALTGLSPEGDLGLGLAGAPGFSYLLQSTTNLFDWSPVAVLRLTNSPTVTDAILRLGNTQTATTTGRYYRAVLEP